MVGNAKINNLKYVAILLEEHVLRLQISVNDAHVIEIQQYLQNLFDDLCDIVFGELLTGDDLLEEFPSLAQLNDEDVVRLVVVYFE